MNAPESLVRDRVILCHFDSYSTALVFARWDGRTMLLPEALPEGSSLLPNPPADAPERDGEAVKAGVVERFGLNPEEIVHVGDYRHWVQTPEGPLRVHLLRFTTFEAPKALLEPHGAVFKPIHELRGSAMSELMLLREVFNLIIGAGGGRV